jgi:hypothetical protein
MDVDGCLRKTNSNIMLSKTVQNRPHTVQCSKEAYWWRESLLGVRKSMSGFGYVFVLSCPTVNSFVGERDGIWMVWTVLDALG